MPVKKAVKKAVKKVTKKAAPKVEKVLTKKERMAMQQGQAK